jgi:hypothetical protein
VVFQNVLGVVAVLFLQDGLDVVHAFVAVQVLVVLFHRGAVNVAEVIVESGQIKEGMDPI